MHTSRKTTGVEMIPIPSFDTQVNASMHKRQLLNVFKILYLYNRMLDDLACCQLQQLLIFSGKAAQSYTFAKEVIRLIHSVADRLTTTSAFEGRLKIVYSKLLLLLGFYAIYAASDTSEQISVAGAEGFWYPAKLTDECGSDPWNI